MSFLTEYGYALKAEKLKLHRSGMFWICFGASLFVPLLSTLVNLFIDTGGDGLNNRWDKFIESNFVGFTSFFYPIFLVLIMVRLVYTEHRSDTWKLMETQPVSKAALYLAKWKIATILSLAILLGLLVFSLLGGFILQVAKPSYKLQDYDISWGKALTAMLRFWLSGLGILSIQYFLGLMIKSFAWPMTIGLIGIITGGMFAGFGVMTWWPYSAPALTASSYNGSVAGDFLIFHEKLSILWSLLFLWLGYRFYVGKTFKLSFLKPLPIALVNLLAIILFIVVLKLVSAPRTLDRYHKTVVSGKLEGENIPPFVYVFSNPTRDTVMRMPVHNGRFGMELKDSLPISMYLIQAGNFRNEVFFGSGDSISIEINLPERKQPEMKIRGTRLAENEYLRLNTRRPFYMLEDYAYQYKSDSYAAEIWEEWKAGIKSIESFKTVDNIRPSSDFIKLQRKLLAMELIQLADHYYPTIHSLYYPGEKLVYPEKLEVVRKEADVNEPGLIPFRAFRGMLIERARNKAGRNDSLFLATLNNSVTRPEVRHIALYEAIENDVFRVRDSVRRAKLFQQALSYIDNPMVRSNLSQKYTRLLHLMPNRKAPNFSAMALNDSTFNLEKFKGRFLVIDLWATWCGPCKKEAPYFEDLAERYTGNEMLFLSISLDEQKNDWLMETAGKKTKVLNLWATNKEVDFAQNYSVAYIPRFMLISPGGNILNAEMPPPSDPDFESILQKEFAKYKGRGF